MKLEVYMLLIINYFEGTHKDGDDSDQNGRMTTVFGSLWPMGRTS